MATNDRLNDVPELQDDKQAEAFAREAIARSSRLPIMLGSIVVVGLLVAMFFVPGHHHGTLTYAVQSRENLRSLMDNAPSPIPGVSTVEVLLAAEGDLSLDGKSLGKQRRQSLRLAPGDHILVARQGSHTLKEQLRMPANESLRVEFKEDAVRVFRELNSTALPN